VQPLPPNSAGTFGALTSSLKFAHAKKVDWRACTYMGAPAVFGSLLAAARWVLQNLGRTRGDRLDDCHYAFVLLKPQFGMEAALASPAITESRSQIAKLAVSGFVIDFMMVFLTGTGTFLFCFAVWSLDFCMEPVLQK